MYYMKFKIVLERDEDGGFVATVPSLPGCISQGDTEREALKNIKEAITLHMEALAADGQPLIKSVGKKVKESVVSISL
jgi:predicted RNase H-like HicB family nuclease